MNSDAMDEIKRHFSIVAEGFQHDLQQVGEGHQVIWSQRQQFREEIRGGFKEVKPS